jgi:glycosyltransferase involved in cell wall biosynthesis
MKLGAFETTGRGPEAEALRACVMTIQQGARRNYVYTNQLEEAGLLHSAVTDVSWAEDGFGMTAQLLRWIAPQLRRAVARRTVRNIPPGKLKASLLPNIVSAALPFLHQERRFAIVDAAQAFRCRLRGLGGARVVVNYHGNGGSFLDYAKARGAKIATDFVITPDHLEIEQTERARWPGWEGGDTPKHILASYRRRMAWLLRISDLYLCPSQTVVNGLSHIPGFDAARVRLVPYGISGVLLKKPQPVTGRVLFAGAAGLRKGLPYLAEAASILKQRRPEIEIAVAGEATALVRNREETRDLTFLGILGREAMAEEFARADIYCLPSLAEGSATSIFEAMANGLPTVTTASSGSIIEDGAEGLIVPERNGLAIADAIERIVADRALRHAMSKAAVAAARRYDDETCGRRFIEVICELASGYVTLGAGGEGAAKDKARGTTAARGGAPAPACGEPTTAATGRD